MKFKVYFAIISFLTIQWAHAQIGIGTTSPNATLDIRSSNQALPANTDGILVPKIDAFPAINPTASQNGMLVFLTTTSGANQPGFYYWNDTTTSWIGINSSANSDADWYKVGTSTAPTLITDDMFHTGNVAIGKNSANYPLEIQSTNVKRGINSVYSSSISNTIDNIGINNSVSVTSTDDTYGILNSLDGAGTGLKYGSYNYINPSAGGTHYGIYSEVLKVGTHYAAYFLGHVSIGTTALNNYILPPSRGTLGQIMQTDGSGNLTWQSPNNLGWLTTGNAGTASGANFMGTTDNQDIVFKRFGIRAGYIGDPAYDGSFNYNNGNTSFGGNSMLNPSINFASQFGVRNSAFGANVMPGLTTGQRNTGMGDFALFSNTSGSENTAIGSGALFSNATSNFNVAIGRQAMTTYNAPFLANTGNTAVGFASLRNSVIGTNNVALGYEALRNVTGNGNIGIGFQAGRLETGSDKLYIENSNADQNGALIYGDFNTNILRVNGQVQIGNPTVTGYALPTSRGTNTQVLQTDGAGSTAWVNSTTLAITETDPEVTSTTTNAIPKWDGVALVDGVAVDDGTNIGIGIIPSAGNKLEVDGKTKTTDFQMTTGAANKAFLQSDASGNASWVSLSLVRTNLGANQALTNTGWQLVTFNTVVFDLNTEFNTGTNRFVALNTGYYEVNAGFHTNNQSNANFYSIGIRKNGTLYQQNSGNHSFVGPVSRTINGVLFLTAGDYVEIFAENSEVGVNIDSNAAKTYFEVKQLR